MEKAQRRPAVALGAEQAKEAGVIIKPTKAVTKSDKYGKDPVPSQTAAVKAALRK